MFKRFQGLIAGILIGVIMTGGMTFAKQGTEMIEALYSNVKIYIDGKKIDPKDANGNTVEPFIYNGTTYLPVRAVGEAFGKVVAWDGSTSSVYVGLAPEDTTTATPTGTPKSTVTATSVPIETPVDEKSTYPLLNFGQTYQCSFDTVGEVDWYKITTTEDCSNYSFVLKNLGVDGSIGVAVFDKYDVSMGGVTLGYYSNVSGIKKGSDGRTDLQNLEPNTTYFICITRYDKGKLGRYTLTINEYI